MNWTKEIPTVDGYYWIRSDVGTWLQDIRDSCIWEDTWDNWFLLNVKDGYEFYGPLEEPK